jgi:glycosyltransferase involved in cell wall biosynthesis
VAVTVPPEVDWLLELLCGQDWPQGDEDALRRTSQAWMDAMLGIAGLADNSDLTSLSVHANAEATSGDAFKSFWDSYLNGDADLSASVFGGLFTQCEAQAKALVDQANEVEYTKLIIVFTLILVAIQIAWAVASAVMTLGGSLTEIPLAMFIGRESIVIALGRFLQMALMMLVPDLIAQTVMLAQGRGWDGSKTLSSAENALVGGVLGSFLGAGMSKLPWMGEDFAKTAGGKVVQGLSHFVEGGLVNDATTLATVGTQYAWADLHGDQTTMNALSQQLTLGSLFHQFLQGGALATVFYLPHLALPEGTPMTFTDADGNKYQVALSDKTLAAFEANEGQPAGDGIPIFNQHGYGIGKVSFDGDTAIIDYNFGGGSKTIDLTDNGYTIGGHDGSLTTYGYDDSGQPKIVSYVRPSNGEVTIPIEGGDKTVPAGSMVHYTADDFPYRADIVDGDKVTTWQTGNLGEPLKVTGVTVHNSVPLISGVFGVRSSTFYGADGTDGQPIGSTSWFTGHNNIPDAQAYRDALGDRYSPLAQQGTANPTAPTNPAGDLTTVQLTHGDGGSLAAMTAGHIGAGSGQEDGTRSADQPVVVPFVFDPSSALAFSDTGEAMAYAERVWEQAVGKLTPEQLAAVQAYTGEAIVGSDDLPSYQAINQYLRGRIEVTPELADRIRDSIAKIDEALKLQPVPQDVVVNRTTNSSAFRSADGQPITDLADLTSIVGSVQESERYLSTQFGAYHYGYEEVALHLTVPEGTPALYLGTISFDATQHELLLGRGLSFQVDRVWFDETWHVEAHILGDRDEVPALRLGGDEGWKPGEAETELANRQPRITPEHFAEPDRGASESFMEWRGSDLWTRVTPDDWRYPRELAAYSTDQMLGFNLVPTTAQGSFDTPDANGIGSLQEFVPGSEGRPVAEYPAGDQQRMAVLDYVIGNSDRHGSNYLTYRDGRPAAIDNGESFPATSNEEISSRFVYNWQGKELSPDVLEQVRAVDLDAFREMLLARGIGDEAVNGAVARLAEIQHAGMIAGAAYDGRIYDYSRIDALMTGLPAPPVRMAEIRSAVAEGDHFRLEISDGIRSVQVRVDLDEAARRLVVSPFYENGQVLREMAGLAKGQDGVFDVFSHADENGLLINGLHLPFENLADLLPKLPGGTTIRLAGCDAGSGDALAELARVSGHDVLATDRPVWIDKNGNVFATTMEHGKPALGRNLKPDGVWSVFHPDGTVTERGQDTEVLPGTDATLRLALGDQPPPGERPEELLLKDVFGPPKSVMPLDHRVVIEDEQVRIRAVRKQPVDDPAAELDRLERLELLDAVRRRFLADHPTADRSFNAGSDATAEDELPAWLRDQPGKILLVTTFWEISQGGVPVFNHELATAFANAGHDVYVAVLDENLQPALQHTVEGVTLFTHTADLPADVDLVIGHTRFSGQQAQDIRANFYPDAPLAHFQHMVPEELGLVKAGEEVYRAPRVGEYETIVSEKVNGTTVSHLEKVDSSGDYGVARLEDGLGRTVFKELRKGEVNSENERRLVIKADLGVGVGPAITRDTQRLASDSQTIVREVIPGLDFSRQVGRPLLDESGQPVDGQYNVLLIGRADEAQKGTLQAARMVAALNDDGLNVRLTIRGFPAGQDDKMAALAAQLSAEAKSPVTVLPFTDDISQLNADLSSAHLVIAPGSGEGFGMSASGAAAAGVPVLVPDGSGFGEFLADPRNVPPDISGTMIVQQKFADQISVDDWAGKMSEVLRDLPTAQQHSNDLVSQLQERTWRGTANSVLDAVRDLYHSQAARPPADQVRFADIRSVVPEGNHLRVEISDGGRTVAVRVDVTPERLVICTFDENGQVLRELAGLAAGKPGVFDVFTHADASGVVIDGLHLPFEKLAEYLPELPEGTTIRLNGCDAGYRDALSELARVSGHDVLAADRPVWGDHHGNLFAASERYKNGQLAPVIGPDGRADGNWRVFHPDRTVTDLGPDSQPLAHLAEPGETLVRLGGEAPRVTYDQSGVNEDGSVALVPAVEGTRPWVLEVGAHSDDSWLGPVTEITYGPAGDLGPNIFGLGDPAVTRQLEMFPGTMDAVVVHDAQSVPRSVDELGAALRPGGILVLEGAARPAELPPGYELVHSSESGVVILKQLAEVHIDQADVSTQRPVDYGKLIDLMNEKISDPSYLPEPIEIENRYGITQENQRLFQYFADKYGLAIDVRPSNKEAVPLLELGGVPKPPAIKMKTINPLDVLLGARDMIGAVGYFNPKLPDRAEVPANVWPELEKIWPALTKRFNDRVGEFNYYADTVADLTSRREFRVVDGVVYPFTPVETLHPAERYGTLLVDPVTREAFADGQTGLRVPSVSPVIDPELGPPVTGDHDMFNIRFDDNRDLPYDRPEVPPGYPEPMFYKRLVNEAGMTDDQIRGKGPETGEMLAWPMGVQHGAMRVYMLHEDVSEHDLETIFEPIIARHMPGGEPLIRFQVDREPMLVNAMTPVDQLRLPAGPPEPLLLTAGHAADQHPVSPVIEALKVEFVPPSHDFRVPVTDGTRTIAVRIDQTPERLVVSTFDENGQVLRELAGLAPPQPGVFDVFSHADENGLVIDGMPVPFERLAEYLPELPDDAVIRLCGCDAASSTAIAELARVTGHDVLAADHAMWLDRHGNVFSASERDENGLAVPALDPGGRANGVWKVFHPDGSVTDRGPDTQPVAYVPGDEVIRLGPGDIFNGSTIFGPRSGRRRRGICRRA